MKFNTPYLLIMVCIMCQTVFLNCVNGNSQPIEFSFKNTTQYPTISHNIGKDILPDEKFPSPYSDEIYKAIEENPWYGTRHYGDCATGSEAGFLKFRDILKDAPFEGIIPFLNHKAEYVRAAALDIIKEKRELWKSEIQTAYENGDSRIKLELLDYVDLDASIEKRFGLLDEIIQNPKLRVYRTDLEQLKKTDVFKNLIHTYGIKTENFPFDIVGFYARLLEDHFVLDRGIALRQLANFGPDAERAVPALVALMKLDDTKNTKVNGIVYPGHSENALAAIALGKIGLKNDDVISILKDFIDKSPDESSFAAFALHVLGDDSRDYIEFLLDMLDDPNCSSYRTQIIQGLGLIGPDAKRTIPILEKLYVDDDLEIRMISDYALKQIEGVQAALERDLHNLKHKNPEIRKDAIHDLASDADNPTVKEALFEVIKKDQNSEVVFSACSTLKDWGEVKSNELLDGYIRVLELDGSDDFSCSQVVYMIDDMGIEGKKALPALVNYLGAEKNYDLDATISAIVSVGGDYKTIVERLLDAMNFDNDHKIVVIKILGDLGSNAIDALPMLFSEYMKSGDVLKPPYTGSVYYLNNSAYNAILLILRSAKNNNTEIPPEYLIPVLTSKNNSISDLAIEILRNSDAETSTILDNLSKQLNSNDEELRNATIKRIGKLGDKALPLVYILLKQEDKYHASQAITEMLMSLKPGGNYDDDMVLECLQSYDGVEKDHINKVLELGVPEEKIIMKIAEIAGSDFSTSSFESLFILGQYREKAVVTLPVLRSIYKFDSNGHLTNQGLDSVACIISSIKPESKITIPEILNMTECDNNRIIEDSIQAVLVKGGNWDQIATKLAGNVLCKNESTGSAANYTLNLNHDNCTAALPVLRNYDFSNVQRWKFRYDVDQTIDYLLNSVNNNSSVSLDDVFAFMNLGSDSHKFEVSNAVARITGNYDKAAEMLAKMSSDKNNETREYCLKVLYELGGNAKAALPILRKIKPIDKIHKELLERAVNEIETGKIRPIADVANQHSYPSLPKRPEMYPYGVLSTQFHVQQNDDAHSSINILVDTNMPKGDDEERLQNKSNWKFNYKDGSKFPDIVEINANVKWADADWEIIFSNDFVANKEVSISIKLPDGKYSTEYYFTTPSEEFMKQHKETK